MDLQLNARRQGSFQGSCRHERRIQQWKLRLEDLREKHFLIHWSVSEFLPPAITTMWPTLRRFMAAAAQSSALKPSMNLLPPIPLYRRLLRAHRKHLPPEMRLLGDEYVKAEFRAHRDVENPVHLVSRHGETASSD